MSQDLNAVNLVGRLTKDPEMQYTKSGTAMTKMSIANNYIVKSGDETRNEVNYFDVTVWGNQATNCEKYLKKGSQVIISGELRQDRWTDSTTQQARSKIGIQANRIQFLGGNSEKKDIDVSKKDIQQSPQQDPWNDDVPF